MDQRAGGCALNRHVLISAPSLISPSPVGLKPACWTDKGRGLLVLWTEKGHASFADTQSRTGETQLGQARCASECISHAPPLPPPHFSTLPLWLFC